MHNAFQTTYTNGTFEETNNKVNVIKRVSNGDRIYLI
ncbi:hypothetical protein [Enterococcus faecium]|nr:hypothetical protein [Enterococcus faecium]